MDFSRIMQSTGTFKGTGVVDGHARIDTTGNSMAQMLGRGNGDLVLFMSGGDVSALLVIWPASTSAARCCRSGAAEPHPIRAARSPTSACSREPSVRARCWWTRSRPTIGATVPSIFKNETIGVPAQHRAQACQHRVSADAD